MIPVLNIIRPVSQIFFLLIFLIFITESIVEGTTRNEVYNSTGEIPYNRVGLLLGTSKFLGDGRINLFYKYRIEAAFKLYESGKIDFILVSGDNSTTRYNEPSTIRKDLIEKGIPKDRIFLDFAGFRTFDSVIRSKEVFGQDSITVISQQFHNERAIFIAKSKRINAIGFNAKHVDTRSAYKTYIRERFARVKMVMDLIFGKKPKFLGEEIEIK
ncbi:MAG: vancomycin high temperature exclusion protein [bacterium]|nr:vancomycin high temperature exclusion protein [bacterium]